MLDTLPVSNSQPARDHYDVIIVGSGMGGGTLAYALKNASLSVLVVERGDFLPQEPENWDAEAVFVDGRYKNAEKWYDASNGAAFSPGTYYYVGGNTKLYGASLVRFRREDFRHADLADGPSPAWPVDYEEFEPHYGAAERLYRVHGEDDDPTLARSQPFPFAPVDHEPPIARTAAGLRDLGLTPSHLALGVDLRQGGACIKCATCDGFPCRVLAKGDADVCGIRPAIATGAVELLTNAYVTRVTTDSTGGRATGIECRIGARVVTLRANTVVVSCGAVNSAALLLRSATDQHAAGLANSSGQVGRNYMVHNNSIMVAINPLRRNKVTFQKTLYVNDYYLHGTVEHPYPLGHVQLIGKLQGAMIKAQRPHIPMWALNAATRRSIDWWLFSEDIPDHENRVTLRADGSIQIAWKPNNVVTHKALVREMRKVMRKLGYPIVISESTGIDVNSHQAGTIRAGSDPRTSVLDPDCRAHDVDNLFVVDSAFFPSLPVMNPALTIAANALRVAPVIAETARQHAEFGARSAP